MRYLFKSKSLTFLAIAAFIVGGFFIFTGGALAATIVSPSNMQGWTESSANGGSATLVADSSNHVGTGALQLVTTSDVNAVTHFTRAFDIKLSDLTQLSYDTKQISAVDATDGNATLRVNISYSDDTAGTVSDKLMYEPYYNGFAGGHRGILGT